jgi:hypothetical protein
VTRSVILDQCVTVSFRKVDPATLHLPGGRRCGVDPMSNQETRAELLEALGELGRAHPNRRLGQALSNLAMAPGRQDAGGVWKKAGGLPWDGLVA